MTLIRRLQEYERFKVGGERLNALPRVEREIYIAAARRRIRLSQATTPEVHG